MGKNKHVKMKAHTSVRTMLPLSVLVAAASAVATFYCHNELTSCDVDHGLRFAAAIKLRAIAPAVTLPDLVRDQWINLDELDDILTEDLLSKAKTDMSSLKQKFYEYLGNAAVDYDWKTLPLGDFKIEGDKLLGAGGFGEVYKASLIKGQPVQAQGYVCKKIIKEKVKKAQMSKEVKIMMLLTLRPHKNVGTLVKVFEDSKHVYIIMPQYTGGDLGDLEETKPQPRNEVEVASIMRQLFSGIEHMHELGIVHRDLKLENLMLEDPSSGEMQLKIIDFGLSAKVTKDAPSELKDGCGTIEYIAPEVVKGVGYGKPVDIWGAGIIMYTLLTGGHIPHNIPNTLLNEKHQQNEILKNLAQNSSPFRKGWLAGGPRTLCMGIDFLNNVFKSVNNGSLKAISETTKQFLTTILNVDPCTRPDATKCLADPFLQESTSTEAPRKAADGGRNSPTSPLVRSLGLA